MKTADLSLYQLIQSLTASEKRYFKRYAQRHSTQGDNHYLVLFDAVAEQKDYNETALKQQFAMGRAPSYFAVLKHYLYQQILDALHLFHLSASPEASIQKQLHTITILLQKGLTTEAQKQCSKARKAILKNELWDLYPSIAIRQRQIWERQFFKGITDEALAQWKHDMEEQLKLLQHEMQYALAHARLARMQYQKIGLNTEDTQQLAAAIMEEILFDDIDRAKTLRAKVDFHRTRSTFFFMQGHPPKAYSENQALLQLFEEHPVLFTFFPQRYLSVLHNFLIDNLQLKKFEVLEEGLQKLKQLPQQKAMARVPKLESRIFELSTLLELNMWLARQQYDRAYEARLTIKAGIERFGKQIATHNRLSFQYLLALTCFEKHNWEEALDWLHDLLHSPKKNVMEELHRFAQLLSLIIHFELAHTQLLPYHMQSYRRQFAGLWYKSEEVLFQYFKQYLEVVSVKRQRALRKALCEQLIALKDSPGEQRVFKYIDLERWANQ